MAAIGTKKKNPSIRGSERGPIPQAYLRLVQRFRLRPIQSELDLAEAAALADELFDRAELLSEEEQYLEVLCDLIESFEDENYPIPDATAAEMLRFLIDQRAVSQQTVAKETGVANTVITAVLKGGRKLTRKQMETFAGYFGVEPAVFLPGNGVGQSASRLRGRRKLR
jgi:HTH-type transcriptional regulator/antitoxin HigA